MQFDSLKLRFVARLFEIVFLCRNIYLLVKQHPGEHTRIDIGKLSFDTHLEKAEEELFYLTLSWGTYKIFYQTIKIFISYSYRART